MRLPSTLLPAVFFFLFIVCGGLHLSAEEAAPPVPKTPLPAHTAATYHFEEGEWYQSRVNIVGKGPIEPDDGDVWYYSFKSTMSVWRFNPESGDYDIAIRGPLGASTTLSFRYYGSGDDEVLMMTEAMGSRYAMGGAGIPNCGGTTVRMDISPPILATNNMTRIENELNLTVITRVQVQPSPASKERGVPVKSTQVSRSVLVKSLPEKRAQFVEKEK